MPRLRRSPGPRHVLTAHRKGRPPLCSRPHLAHPAIHAEAGKGGLAPPLNAFPRPRAKYERKARGPPGTQRKGQPHAMSTRQVFVDRQGPRRTTRNRLTQRRVRFLAEADRPTKTGTVPHHQRHRGGGNGDPGGSGAAPGFAARVLAARALLRSASSADRLRPFDRVEQKRTRDRGTRPQTAADRNARRPTPRGPGFALGLRRSHSPPALTLRAS